MSDYEVENYPPKPEEPFETDCCGSGCNPCVFDIYRIELEKWKNLCEKLKKNLGGIESMQQQVCLSTIMYKPFQLICVESHTHNTNIYTFQAIQMSNTNKESSENMLFTIIKEKLNVCIGQHLVMLGHILSNDDNISEHKLSRSYTPISKAESESQGKFQVLIKLYEDGKMSNFIRTLKEGDVVYWKGPYGSFQYIPNTFKHIIMFCAGTGIAPMFRIASSIVENENDETWVSVNYTCRSQKDILLLCDLRELSSFWNFKFKVFLTGLGEQGFKHDERIITGRINESIVLKEIYNKPFTQTLVLVCGTKSFCKDIIKYVKQTEIPETNIYIF